VSGVSSEQSTGRGPQGQRAARCRAGVFSGLRFRPGTCPAGAHEGQPGDLV